MNNKYEFKGSKFPWNLSPAIHRIYSSPNDNHIDSGHDVCNVTVGDWGDQYPVIKCVGSDLMGQYKVDTEMIVYGHTPKEIAQANALMIKHCGELFKACVNFINKVESGRARSTESYNEMKRAVELSLGLIKEEDKE